MSRKGKTNLRKCKICGEQFLSADVKTRWCDTCKQRPHFCRCGCGGVVVGLHREYLPYHAQRDQNNIKMYGGHKRQARAISGESNPAKAEDVKKKISEALMGRVCWREGGKTQEEIQEMGEKLARNLMNNRYQKIHVAKDGKKYRSSLEVKVADLLFSMGVDYVYERRLNLPNGVVYPDFSFMSGDDLRCLLEVTGSAFEEWREKFKAKVGRIRDEYPNLPIVVVTYSTSLSYLKEIEALPFVRIWTIGPQDRSEQKTLIVESDHFNFDYSHFLPWHKGKCADYHGHSSTISVAVTGLADGKGMVIDFSEVKRIVKEKIDVFDHKVIVPDYSVKEHDKDRVWIEFESKGRKHEMTLPISEVCVLDCDSTVENISMAMAALILDGMPINVTEVAVRMNEGIGKSAVSTASVVGRNLRGEMRMEERPGDFLKMLTFYKDVPMVGGEEWLETLGGSK